MDTRQMFGRRKIYTDTEHISAENVVDVLRKAQLLHSQNQNEIQYLWDYYRGKTPIWGKVRELHLFIPCIPAIEYSASGLINRNNGRDRTSFFIAVFNSFRLLVHHHISNSRTVGCAEVDAKIIFQSSCYGVSPHLNFMPPFSSMSKIL